MTGLNRILHAVTLTVAVVVVFQTSGSVLGEDTSSPGDVTISKLRKNFNSAVNRPLAERAPVLERMRESLSQRLSAGTLGKKAHPQALLLMFDVERQLAEHASAARTFGRYAEAMREAGDVKRARKAVWELVRRRWMAGEHVETACLAAAAAPVFSDDSEGEASLMYLEARAIANQPGRTNEALPLLEKIVSDHPDASARAQAMRTLAHYQGNGYGDGEKAALATLALMEAQYKGTWWEQYAHMKPAMIFEIRQHDPQKALARYEQTLERFPDHRFATYCRRQIERLRGVIEQQLIQDALEGLGKADEVDEDQAQAKLPLDDHLVMWLN